MAHPLIEEIKSSDCFRLYRLSYPQRAARFLARIEADLPEQWKSFLLYKDLHKAGAFKEAMTIGDGRSTGVMPEVYATWAAFSKPAEIPNKVWLRDFVKKHPVLWLYENAFDTTKLTKNI